VNIVEKNVNEIIPYINNPRVNDNAVDKVAASIKEFGFKVPCVISSDNVIVTGHTRIKAAKKLGMETVPCIIADDLTDAQIKAFRLADNKVAEFSEWDFEKLEIEFEGLADFDLEDFGFEIGSEEEEEDTEIIEDEVPEEVETRCKLGDIYQLGGHRLICGDSTDISVIDRLMDGVKADLVFTDPPYGMKKESEGVLNDNLNYDDLLDFNRQWIPLTFGALKDNGSWYCWGIDEPLMDIYSNILKPMAKENKISIQNYITWDKGTGFGQMSNLQRSYSIATEKCWFVICGVQGYNNNSDNYFEGFEPIRSYLDAECEKCGGHKIWKQMLGNNMGHHYFTKSQWCFPTKEAYEKMQAFGKEYGAFGKEYEEIKKQYEEIKKEWYDTRAYFDNTHDNMNDVWHFNRTSESERKHTGGHATPKPIALCSRAIKSSSREGEIVLDIFGGSGSTLIACEQLNRKCYMCELDEHYCDVIIQRWENLTGKQAMRLSDGL
jgi:DNA modification methylase